MLVHSGTALATCDSSAFHLTVTDSDGHPATEADGSSLPAHRLPDGGVGEAYDAQIRISGGTPPYATGYGGYSLPTGITKSISSSPGTSNNDIVTISGSSSQSYAASLILTVLDQNGCGPTPADSRFDWLYGETPTNTGPSPSAPNPITVGDQISCDPGGWTGDANYPAIAYGYEWRRVNSDGTTTTVGSAQTYVAAPQDGGLSLECVVTATNKFGSTQALSGPVRVRYPPKNITLPQILPAGPAAPGTRLTCEKGGWVGASPIAYSYRWIAELGDGSEIVSDSDTYTVDRSYEGGTIHCIVTATNADGTATATSANVPIPRRAHVVGISVVVKGWRSTGNVEWMRRGGPIDAATPQLEFASGEGYVLEYTVKNDGDVASLGSPYGISLVWHGGHLNYVAHLGVPALQPGQEYVATRTFFYTVGTHEPEPTLTIISSVGTVNPGSGTVSYDIGPDASLALRHAIEASPQRVGADLIGGELVLPPELPPADQVEVDISIVERQRNAMVMRVQKRRCHWVAGTSGRLTTITSASGLCGSPVWIRASVRGQRWSVRFKHSLPPGSDVLYTRAFEKSRVFDPLLSKAHNRRVFTIT